MDRRTVYLQELFQISDFLQIQRNMLEAVAGVMFAVAGGNTIVVPLPQTTSDVNPNTNPIIVGLQFTIPPLQIFQLATTDTAWSSLTADATPRFIQGLLKTASIFTITVPPSGSVKSVLVQARLGSVSGNSDPRDITPGIVLPYFPLIQTVTVTGGSTSKIYVTATTGMSVNDQITVQGFAAAANAPIFIQTIGSDGGGPFVTVSPAFTSAPTAGKTFRDVNPNAGSPLSGQANNAVAQSINRVHEVFINTKENQVVGSSASVPSVDAGFVPLFTFVNVANSTTDLQNRYVLHANSPWFPGLVGASHHLGAGKSIASANQINLSTEILYPGTFGGMISLFADPVSALQPTTKQYVDTFAKALTGTYVGNGGNSRAITVGAGIRPNVVHVYSIAAPGTQAGGIIYGTNLGMKWTDVNGGTEDATGLFGSLAATGFVTGSAGAFLNVNTTSYRWIAWT